jgi:hypothetical protein
MTIVITGLLAGLLDALAALSFFLIRGNSNPAMLFRYIASAVFGQKALKGGAPMVLLGLLFHFMIALAWVGLYFLIYPLIAPLGTGSLVNAAVYGLLIWSIMNFVVLPLSRIIRRSDPPYAIVIQILILVVTVGLPCAFTAPAYFQR